MKYQSQKVALAYFYVAMGLFAIQVLGGLLAGWIYVSPNTLSETLPFNIIRMIHTNALIVWLLLGFFGGTYYLLPEEAERAGKPLEDFIRESIVEPDAYVEDGYPAGVMPKTYASLPEEQIDALVQYLVRSSEGGGSR